MPESHFDKLRSAVSQEKVDERMLDLEYKMLMRKMMAYQQGAGPEPTLEEFMRWKTGVARQIEKRKLESGYTDSD